MAAARPVASRKLSRQCWAKEPTMECGSVLVVARSGSSAPARTSSSEREHRPSRARLGVVAPSPPVGEPEQSQSWTSGPGPPALRDMLLALGSAVPRMLGWRSAARQRSCPRALGRRLRPAGWCARGHATTRPTCEAAAAGTATLAFPELISPHSPICYLSGVVLRVKPCRPKGTLRP